MFQTKKKKRKTNELIIVKCRPIQEQTEIKKKSSFAKFRSAY